MLSEFRLIPGPVLCLCSAYRLLESLSDFGLVLFVVIRLEQAWGCLHSGRQDDDGGGGGDIMVRRMSRRSQSIYSHPEARVINGEWTVMVTVTPTPTNISIMFIIFITAV